MVANKKNQREGQMVYSVPQVNCFFGNTNYANAYMGADFCQKLDAIRPTDNN
jgi:hypothetical protein|tara:strand:+ start:472 stop:627 length:156 start_codon:yes stop_codon:yes gene_type:complete